MSLINDMLRDIESRDAGSESRTLPAGTQPEAAPADNARRARLPLVILAVVVSAAGAWAVGDLRATPAEVVAEGRAETLSIVADATPPAAAAPPAPEADPTGTSPVDGPDGKTSDPVETPAPVDAEPEDPVPVPTGPRLVAVVPGGSADSGWLDFEFDAAVDHRLTRLQGGQGVRLVFPSVSGIAPFPEVSDSAAVRVSHDATADGELAVTVHTADDVTVFSRARMGLADEPSSVRIEFAPAAVTTETAVAEVETLPAPPEPTLEIQRAPETPEMRAARAVQAGKVAMTARQFDRAEAAFREAVAAQPEDPQAWELLHGALLAQGKTSEAVDTLRAAMAAVLEPHRPAMVLARFLEKQGDRAQAIAVLERWRPGLARDLEYDALLGALLQRAERYGEAAAIYGRLVQLRPGNATWWTGLAIAEDMQGRRAEALVAYRRARGAGRLSGALADYVDGRIAALK